jgi:hypothetical protein
VLTELTQVAEELRIENSQLRNQRDGAVQQAGMVAYRADVELGERKRFLGRSRLL